MDLNTVFQVNAIGLAMLLPAFVSGGLAIYSFARPPVAGSRTLGLLTLAVCAWSLFYSVELCCLQLQGMMLATLLEYPGIVSIPVFWLLLTMLYTGRESWVSGRNVALLFIMPVITVMMVATNPVHHLYYTSVGIDSSGYIPMLVLSRGPWFWVNTAYSFSLLAWGAVLLVVELTARNTPYRSQVIIMLAGMSLPWITNTVYQFAALLPAAHLDLTPLAFAVSGFIIAWGIFRHGLFTVMPLAYGTIADSMEEAIIVLDKDDRFVALNRSALEVLGIRDNRIGRKAASAFESWPQLAELCKIGAAAGREVCQEGQGGVSWFEASVLQLTGRHGRNMGRVISLHNVTGRKQAEEALKLERWRLERIIEGTHAGTWEWNVQTGETVFNQTWAEILGYTLDDLAPVSIKTWEQLAHPDDLKKSGELLERHFSGELPYYDCECRIRHRDGHWVWVRDRGRVITKTPDGKPLLMFGTHSDITHSKRVEASLQLQRDLALKLGSTADVQTALEKVMQAALGITGIDCGGIYLVDPISGDLDLAVHTGLPAGFVADASHYPANSPNALGAKRGLPFYHRFAEVRRMLSVDDETRPESLRALASVPILSEGKLIAVLNLASRTLDDIPVESRTAIEAMAAQVGSMLARITAEKSLKESEEKFRLLVENANDFVWMLDSGLKLTYVSPSVKRLLGYDPEQLLGRPLSEVLNQENMQLAQQQFEDRQPLFETRSDRSVRLERMWHDKKGMPVWVETVAHAVYNADGRHAGTFGVTRDISERKKVEAALRESEAKYRQVVDHAGEAILVLQELVIKFVNAAGAELAGLTVNELLSRPFMMFIHPEDQERVIGYRALIQRGEKAHSNISFRTRRGQMVEVNTVQIDWEGQPAVLLFMRDITERWKAEEALRESEEKFRMLVENANDIVYSLALDGTFAYVSPTWTRIVGHEVSEVVNRYFGDFVHPEDLAACEEFMQKVMTTGQKQSGIEYRVRCKDGSWRWHSTNASPLHASDGTIVSFIGIGHDINERKYFEQRLLDMATHDGLTGLPNRTLHDRFDMALANSQRSAKKFALMSLDLDKFKVINDTLGHDIGDRLLSAAARRLTGALRKNDTVARVGGDEFVILLAEIDRRADAVNVANKILADFRKPFVIEEHLLHVTISIGIAVLPDDGGDLEQLLQRSDLLLYRAKSRGRDRLALR